MLLTSNFGLKKPEATDPVDVQDFNDNADVIDTELKKRPESDGSATNMTVEFAAATQLTELTSKDSLKGLFGKLALAVKTVIDLAKKLGTSAGSATRPVYFKDGKPTQIDYTLAEACKRGVKSATAVTHTGHGTNSDYLPDISFLSFWNGAYNADGKSNLARCVHGAFGTMATKSADDYVPKSGGAFTGEVSVPDNKVLKAGNKVLIVTTEEGGNITWHSPNGTKYEMDSFSNEFVRIYSGDGDKHIFRLYANGQFDTFYLQSDSGALRDRTGDNRINSGTSGHRWKQVYAGTATISTSDRNLKKWIRTI